MQFPGHEYSLANINEELLRQTKDRLFWIDQDLKEKERDALVCGYILVFQECKLTKVLFYTVFLIQKSSHACCARFTVLPYLLRSGVDVHLRLAPFNSLIKD
jgi:hypothetical protein